MRRIPTCLLLFCLAPLLTQCVAAKKDVQSLELRVRTLDNRMVTLDRDLLELQSQTKQRADKSSVEMLQKQQAKKGDVLDRLRNEMLQVQAQVEEGTHFYRERQEASERHLGTIDTQLADLQAQLNILSQQFAQTNQELTALHEEMAAEKKRQAERAALAAEEAAREAREKAAQASAGPKSIEPDRTKKKVTEASTGTSSTGITSKPTAAPATKAVPPTEKVSPLYDTAMTAFKEKRYREAYTLFADYLAQNPSGGKRPEATYWLGESLFNQGEFELSILEYQKVIDNYRTHERAAAAMLRQGLAFEQLKDNETAKIIFKKLVKEYPESGEAQTGRKRLDTLP